MLSFLIMEVHFELWLINEGNVCGDNHMDSGPLLHRWLAANCRLAILITLATEPVAVEVHCTG